MNLRGLYLSVQAFLPGSELRMLKHQLPNAHRLWVRTGRTLRPETDAEYGARLRQLAQERGLRLAAQERD